MENPYLRETLLPEGRLNPQQLRCLEGESALYQLNGPFDRHVNVDRHEEVNVVRHYNELMQEKFSLRSIVLDRTKE